MYDHQAATVPVGWQKCSAQPARYDGHRLVFSLWTVTAVSEPGRFTIGRVVRDVPVVGLTEGLEVGETVTVLGTFDAGGADGLDGPVVRATEVEEHPLRKAKEALGMLSVLLCLIAGPLVFRWRGGQLEVRRVAARSDGGGGAGSG